MTAKDTWSLFAVTAGLLAVIISYAGPLAISSRPPTPPTPPM